MRGFPVGELQSCDSERPYVRFVVIAWLLDDLRSHPERRAYECVLFRHCSRKLARNPKICKFHLTICWEEDVGGCGSGVSFHCLYEDSEDWPLTSRCNFLSLCRYSNPNSSSLKIMVIYSSWIKPGFIKSAQLPPEQNSIIIHRSEPFRNDPWYLVT